jgi:hypothetical protein
MVTTETKRSRLDEIHQRDQASSISLDR